MQNQPKSDEARVGLVLRARQAIRADDDAFKGGEDAPNPQLGLKRPWLAGRSRLFSRHETEAGAE